MERILPLTVGLIKKTVLVNEYFPEPRYSEKKRES